MFDNEKDSRGSPLLERHYPEDTCVSCAESAQRRVYSYQAAGFQEQPASPEQAMHLATAEPPMSIAQMLPSTTATYYRNNKSISLRMASDCLLRLVR